LNSSVGSTTKLTPFNWFPLKIFDKNHLKIPISVSDDFFIFQAGTDESVNLLRRIPFIFKARCDGEFDLFVVSGMFSSSLGANRSKSK